MTVLALADLHDAAGQAGVPWTLMLDEFGAVIKMAAGRAVAILQPGRSHGGQVIVVTQSVADPEALSGQVGLLPSLTDNFSGIVAHRQTAPESCDWLAKLMGTRALGNRPTRPWATAHTIPDAALPAVSASSGLDPTPSPSLDAARRLSTRRSDRIHDGRPSSPSSSTRPSRSGSAQARGTHASSVSIPRGGYLPQPVPGQAAAISDKTLKLQSSDRATGRDVRLASNRCVPRRAARPGIRWRGSTPVGADVAALIGNRQRDRRRSRCCSTACNIRMPG